MLYTMIFLICASSIPKAECSIDNATDVIPDDRQMSAAWCGLSGQAVLAQTVLVKPGYYPVVCCVPVEKGRGS